MELVASLQKADIGGLNKQVLAEYSPTFAAMEQWELHEVCSHLTVQKFFKSQYKRWVYFINDP